MFNFKDTSDFKYSGVSYNAKTEYSCEESGCDDEGICRCGRIESVEFDYTFQGANAFFGAISAGGKGLDMVLAHWFVRKHYKDLQWDYESSGGYYGDELDRIFICNDGDFFNKAASFQEMTNKERIDYLLTKEYGRVLPKVAQIENWTMEAVFSSDVVNSSNTNLDSSTLRDYEQFCAALVGYPEHRKKFQDLTQMLAPLCIKSGGKYQVIDGRHRTTALQKEYSYKEQVSTVSKKGNAGKKWVTQVFEPVYMWVICPVEEQKK